MAIPSVKLTVAALSAEACEVFGGRYLARFEPSQSSAALLVVESPIALWKLFSDYGVQVDWTPIEHELTNKGAAMQVIDLPDSMSLANLMGGVHAFCTGES